jgi:hypothetical protein
MAIIPISNLPQSGTLSGADLIPIVQDGVTTQAQVSALYNEVEFTGDTSFETDTLYIDTLGSHIGINTADPQDKIHVRGDEQTTAYYRVRIDNPNPNGGSTLRFSNSATNKAALYFTNTTDTLTLQNAASGGSLRLQVTDDSDTTKNAIVIDKDQNITMSNTLSVANTLSAGEINVSGTLSADGIDVGGVGTVEFEAGNNLVLDAGNAVVINNGSLRLNSITTTNRDQLASQNGDIIYNNTTHKFQGYANGAWVDLH